MTMRSLRLFATLTSAPIAIGLSASPYVLAQVSDAQQRAVNVARMRAEKINGGLSRYRAASCMYNTSRGGGDCLINSDGGFIRDSAVYDNTFAYANDDIIELDGGQHNVLVYNNDFSHGYGGISVAPVRRGPSYIFHNTVHSMGDERGMMWAAIKAGGVSSNPEGQVNLFNNYVYSSGNGITASYVQGDDGFWVNAVNNVIITGPATDVSGFSILDKKFDVRSVFTGNYLFNLDTASERFQADITVPFADSTKLNTAFAQSLAEQAAPKTLNIADGLTVANFSKFAGGLITGKIRPVTGAAPYLSFSHVLLEEMLNFNKFWFVYIGSNVCQNLIRFL